MQSFLPDEVATLASTPAAADGSADCALREIDWDKVRLRVAVPACEEKARA